MIIESIIREINKEWDSEDNYIDIDNKMVFNGRAIGNVVYRIKNKKLTIIIDLFNRRIEDICGLFLLVGETKNSSVDFMVK